MNEADLLTIIVPIYNVEPYLHKCIDSILAQSYSHLEIILVDDGSTDNCGSICDEYTFKDKRIKVIHQHNQGLSAARNIGISTAKGIYIGFVDSDDWIAPDMYYNLHAAIINHQADIAVCGVYFKKSTGVFLSPKATDTIKLYTDEAIVKACLTEEILTCAWNKLYKREILNETTFPFGMCYEDLYAMPGILRQCKKVVSIDTPYYYYDPCRESSICNTHTVEMKRQLFNSAVFRNKGIQRDYPNLKTLIAQSQVRFDISIYTTLFGKVKASPERQELMHVILTDLRQYRLSEVLSVPFYLLPATIILRYLPHCFPIYEFFERSLRKLLRNSIRKIKFREIRHEE